MAYIEIKVLLSDYFVDCCGECFMIAADIGPDLYFNQFRAAGDLVCNIVKHIDSILLIIVFVKFGAEWCHHKTPYDSFFSAFPNYVLFYP